MHTTPTTTSTTRSFGRNRRMAVAGLALVTVGLLASCSGSGGKADAKAPTTTKPVATAGGTSTTVASGETGTTAGDQPVDVGEETDTPQAPAPEAPAPQAPAPQAPAPAPQAPTPSGPKPVITSFTTPENIDCHNGMFQTFSASWTTTNATKTMISIDGPGGYRTYGPNGSDSLPFNCSSAHTFLLTAYGANGQTATRSITLQPRNVQPAEPTSDDDEAPVQPAPAPDPADQ